MSGSVRNSLLKEGRLAAALDMLGEEDLVLDVGCDHGYLAAELVLSGRAKRVVASDISPSSVMKAARLADELGISDRMEVVLADGLTHAAECRPPFGIAACGMGGELIAKLLERARNTAKRADIIVMQPMRGEDELRRYLFENGFGIIDERVVNEAGRYYQLISARFGEPNVVPEEFPKDWFRFGWVMAQKPEKELLPLLMRYRRAYERELEKAHKKGRAPVELTEEIARTDALIGMVERNAKCC